MSATSSIEWTDKTWNPVRGCSVISPGCVNCYAMKTAHRFSGAGGPYEGLTKSTSAGPQWTGIVRPVESSLLDPLSWRKPVRVFVNSMSDLFHEDVPDAFIDRVFAVMALASQHTFQILTKRPERMRDYFAKFYDDGCLNETALDPIIRAAVEIGDSPCAANVIEDSAWPLPNVWLGVSVENQHFADERIPLLLQTPAAVRFISAEPLLGPVDLKKFTSKPLYHCPNCGIEKLRDRCVKCGTFDNTATNELVGLDWVIVGGESGAGARPFDLAWARSIVSQCKAAGVPVFVKQLGADPRTQEATTWPNGRITPYPFLHPHLKSSKGGDPSEWPEDLRVRQFPKAAV